jgi:hypothetical protein
VSSRGQQGRVGLARSHQDLAIGGHRWPSAGGRRELTDGTASLVRERKRARADGPRGLALLGRERDERERACGLRARAQCDWATAV